MTFLGKLRSGDRAAAAPAPARTPAAGAPSATSEPARRASNGLKDFLWLLSDVQHGEVLDLGAVNQATVNFFTGRGFKIYSEDLLHAWKDFIGAWERRLRASGSKVGEDEQFTRALLAKRFLDTNLSYPAEKFHAVLLWDVLDYLDEELLPLFVQRLHATVRPGGVVLGLFHSKKPDGFHRYRIPEADTIEVISAPAILPSLRQLQNRDLMNLFGSFRSSKTFVGRDQLREAMFLK